MGRVTPGSRPRSLSDFEPGCFLPLHLPISTLVLPARSTVQPHAQCGAGQRPLPPPARFQRTSGLRVDTSTQDRAGFIAPKAVSGLEHVSWPCPASPLQTPLPFQSHSEHLLRAGVCPHPSLPPVVGCQTPLANAAAPGRGGRVGGAEASLGHVQHPGRALGAERQPAARLWGSFGTGGFPCSLQV